MWNDNLCAMASQRPDLRIVRYGVESAGVEILPVTVGEPYLRLDVPDGDGMLRVNTRLIGSYNAPNVAAALCVGQYFGVALKDAAAAVDWKGQTVTCWCWTHIMRILPA